MNGREKYYVDVEKKIADISIQKERVQEYARRLYDMHKIPIDVSVDYLTLRKNVNEATPEVAFAFGQILEVKPDKAFSSSQIYKYASYVYEVEQLPKQLEYEMVQITDDQWIGRISVAELMRLRNAQIINYNENTQRVMKRINKGTREIYSISLNKKAIMSMEELFKNGTYIPNTITLNMPEGTNFTYRNGLLIIKKLDHFDITDGYHRYIAMSNLYNMDKDFDYPMELRITNYSEDKSRQLIWQEDQKTKMARIDSESMNMNATANKIVQRLNINSTFNMTGMISSNNGIINAAEFAEIVRATYLPVHKMFSKQQELAAVVNAEKELREGINYITEENMELLSHPWNRYFLYCLVYNINTKVDKEKLLSETNRMAQKAYDEKMFRGREITRIDMKRLAGMKKKGGR